MLLLIVEIHVNVCVCHNVVTSVAGGNRVKLTIKMLR
jgi:hypothetical protein